MDLLDRILTEAFPPKKAGSGKPPSANVSGGPKPPKPGAGAAKPNPFAGGGKKPFPPKKGGAMPGGGPGGDADDADESPMGGGPGGNGPEDPFGQDPNMMGMDGETFEAMQAAEQERERQEAEIRAAQEAEEQAEREKIKQMRAQADAEVASDLDMKYNEEDDQVLFYPHIDQIAANSEGETFAGHLDKKMKGEEDNEDAPAVGDEDEPTPNEDGDEQHGEQDADDMPDGTDVDKSEGDKEEIDTDEKVHRFSAIDDGEEDGHAQEVLAPARRGSPHVEDDIDKPVPSKKAKHGIPKSDESADEADESLLPGDGSSDGVLNGRGDADHDEESNLADEDEAGDEENDDEETDDEVNPKQKKRLKDVFDMENE